MSAPTLIRVRLPDRPAPSAVPLAAPGTVAAPAGQTGHWQACDPGSLQGAPDLTRQGCKSVGLVGKTEYWRCPAPIQGGPGS